MGRRRAKKVIWTPDRWNVDVWRDLPNTGARRRRRGNREVRAGGWLFLKDVVVNFDYMNVVSIACPSRIKVDAHAGDTAQRFLPCPKSRLCPHGAGLCEVLP